MNKIAEAIRATAQAMDQRTSLVIFEVFVILPHYTPFLLARRRATETRGTSRLLRMQFSLKDRMFSSFS